MAGTVGLLDTEPCSDLELLTRVAAGIRALSPDVVRGLPTSEDRDAVRRELDRAVERLRSADIDVVRDGE
ncbi:hypothetical protein [Nocardia carnea]|uniref:hypothetical protein n=1 Tax=Nocardia carnea TaxID=37328 RepID=UPI002453EC4B|nr:hypothetical protein [Nocardia carnea]